MCHIYYGSLLAVILNCYAGHGFMKVTVEIDCTPAEARQFFGLPNVEPMQAAMMTKLEKGISEDVVRLST